MPVRPTPDALRERVFAILGARIEGAHVLDLFAGTGAIGFEAMSRGAEAAVFVEIHRATARIIAGNRDVLSVDPEVGRLMVAPADKAVRLLARRSAIFDLIWADPPFDRWIEGAQALSLAVELDVLGPEGTLCLECPIKADTTLLPTNLSLKRDVSSGGSRVLILGR